MRDARSSIGALEARLPGRVPPGRVERGAHDVPCGGPFAVFVRAEHEDDLRVVADVIAHRRTRARRRAGLEPARLRRRLRRRCDHAGRRARAARHRRRAGDVAAGGGVALPVLARRAAAAGVGGPGVLRRHSRLRRRRGAHERRRARRRHRRRDRHRRVDRSRRRRDPGAEPSRPGARLPASALAPRASWSARVLGPGRRPRPAPNASTRSSAGAASTNPAARTRDRCSRNPPGDAAGRLIEAPVARASASAARSSPRSTPTSSSPIPVRRPPTSTRSSRSCNDVVEEASGVHLEPELRCIGFRRRSVGDRCRSIRGSASAVSK